MYDRRVKNLCASRKAVVLPATATWMHEKRFYIWAALLLVCTAVSGCAGSVRQPSQPSPPSPADPSEHFNRKVFSFNVAFDHAITRPIARGYTHLPAPVRLGVHDFVQNLGEPEVLINDVLQGNALRSLTTGGRFVVNSTIGIGGFIDVAKHMGMPYHNADLGQTFGVWGIGPGRVLEIPILGSLNVRDTVGTVVGGFINPLGQSPSTVVTALNTAKSVGGIVDGRARALPVTDRLEKSDDYYAAMRDLKIKQRARFVVEGKVGAVKPSHHELEGKDASEPKNAP